MPCYHPLSAWRDKSSGAILFVDRGFGDRIDLPCGRCIGCRLERSRQWATRIMFEAQAHEKTSFLTLTYSDENLPSPPSLRYRDYQLFMKRLRKQFGNVRYYMCGEYGETTRRPHYHACIFGQDFSDDRRLHSVTTAGNKLYTSATLANLWGLGHCIIGELTFDSAAYVARYVMKKVTGDPAKEHYSYTDADGVVSQLEPEFCRMSLKPGIGALWFDKFHNDVYPHDFVVINGTKCKPPRYFDKLLKRKNPQLLVDVQDDREYNAYLNRDDSSDSRLEVRETVKLAAIKHFSRNQQ